MQTLDPFLCTSSLLKQSGLSWFEDIFLAYVCGDESYINQCFIKGNVNANTGGSLDSKANH